MSRFQRLWRNYSLSIVLAALFLSSWLIQLVCEWFVWVDEQVAHGEPLRWTSFLAQFWQSTTENWQSEFLQLLAFVTLTSFLHHKGSPEARDSDDEMQATLARIERRLEAIEKRR